MATVREITIEASEKPATKRRRNTDRLREQTRLRILDAATEMFAEYGYFGVTIRDIAKNAGVSLGLIYHYFGSKEDLLGAQIEYTTGVWLEEFEGQFEGKNYATLADFLIDYLMYMRRFIQQDHPSFYRFYMKHIHLDNLPHLDYLFERVGAIQPFFQKHINQAIERGELRQDTKPHLLAFFVEMLSSRLQEAFYSEFLGMELHLVEADENRAREEIAEAVQLSLGGILRK